MLIQSPDKGLNYLVPASMLDNRECPDCENVLFSRGTIKTPYGFTKVGTASLPLNSGDIVHGLTLYKELDGTEHTVIKTLDKLYERDTVNDVWIDTTPSGDIIKSNLYSPVSFVEVRHTDAILADGSGAEQYKHLLVCDGGMSPIFRWSGKFEDSFYELAGGDGYHETDVSPTTPTSHYAQQVVLFYNHVILLNPKTWDATNNVFRDNPQTVLYGKAGLLEGNDCYKITDNGAGAIELSDTGDENVWAAILGSQLIVYQKHSIWSLSHIGGTAIFSARIEIPDIGLLAPHLLTSFGNRHYFVGSDFNIYEYSGGSYYTRIGDKISDKLKELVSYQNLNRCWIALGANNRRIWIFYVEDGKNYATRAFGVDTKTGAWMIRDFSHVWSNGGVTAVALIGGQSYMIGETYQQAIDSEETYNEAITSGETYRDVLEEILVEESLMLGDNSGNIYQYSADISTDDSNNIPAYFVTKVFDLQSPNLLKWWDGITVFAKGTELQVSYRIDNFQTDDTGWISIGTTVLTSEYLDYFFDFSASSKQIQFKFANVDGSSFQINGFEINEPIAGGEV